MKNNLRLIEIPDNLYIIVYIYLFIKLTKYNQFLNNKYILYFI